MTRLTWLARLAALSTLASALLVSGCDSDRCATDDDGCEIGRAPVYDDDQRPLPPPHQAPCRSACAALLDECGSSATEDEGVASCIDYCEQQKLSDDEVACLSSVACGEPTDQCLGA